MVGKKGY